MRVEERIAAGSSGSAVAAAKTACPACLSSDTYLEFPRVDKGLGAFDVRRCRKCRLSFVEGRVPEGTLDGWYRDYHALGSGQEKPVRFFDADKIRRRLEVFFFNFPGNARALKSLSLLDVGCGDGSMLVGLTPYFTRVAGLERSEQAVAACRRIGLQVTTGGLEDGYLPDASFDVVTLFDLIEHLEDPRKAAAALGRIVKPGGWLCITTPNAESLKYRLLGPRWEYCAPPDHLNLFSAKSIEALVAPAGFSVVRVRPSSRLEVFPLFGIYDTWRYWTGRNRKTLRPAACADNAVPEFVANRSFAKRCLREGVKAAVSVPETLVSAAVNLTGRSSYLYVFARKTANA